MIVVRAPLRVSFVGGGTDLPSFYRKRKGQVLSATIDKYVYVVINRTPMLHQVSARYSISETVPHPKELQHTRIKEALLDLGIEKGLEIASFATLPSRTGLGSSSSFSVALLKGLHAYQDKKIDAHDLGAAASRLEIDLVGEPIGKQDQYASALGGFNIIQFHADESVKSESLLLDFETRLKFEDHLLLFYTGITRDASSVLKKQSQVSSEEEKFRTLSDMADSVPEFKDRLLGGDIKGVGHMLHEGWMRKKSLVGNISNGAIDALYDEGIRSGAWGGKVLGAGGGGCLLFVVSPDKKKELAVRLGRVAAKEGLSDYQVVPFHFVQSGAQVLYNGDHFHKEILN